MKLLSNYLQNILGFSVFSLLICLVGSDVDRKGNTTIFKWLTKQFSKTQFWNYSATNTSYSLKSFL